MSPSGGLTRSQIENWDITHLETAATRWRASATEFEDLFAQHRQNVSGTDWEGTAKDAALDRLTADSSVVGRQGDVARSAGDLADESVADLRAAVQKVLTAIGEAEADGFRVAEDLKVIDTRRWDINTATERNRALAEHVENIRWNAEQLVQTDTLIGERLQVKATELEGITFDGADGGTIQAASFGGDGFKQWPFLDDDKPWEYNLDLTTRVWLDSPGKPSAGTIMSVDDVWKELNRCFNCNFPMGGAPAKLPKVGDQLPLEIERFGIHAADFPVEVTQIDKSANEINIEFATLPGHVDGEGSTIHFRFYESGGEVHLGIRGYIAHGPGTDEGWVGAPIRAGYGEVAKVTWQPYIDRLAANIAAAEGAVPVLTKGP
ncbi:hypothetical protein [Mycobacterium syngnathidarum]